jgi:hypothetical protein
MQSDSIVACAVKIAAVARTGGYIFETNVDPDAAQGRVTMNELEATETAARIILRCNRVPKVTESAMGGWNVRYK